MAEAPLSRQYWDGVARRMAAGYHLDPVMAEHKRRVHLDLLEEWCSPGAGSRVLKTDLFEEALGPDQVLIDWPPPAAGSFVIGCDISREILARARSRLGAAGRTVAVCVADARDLPLRDGSVDVLFSCSTLDHFENGAQLRRALEETIRVVRPGGEIVLTLDNPASLFYGFVRWLDRRGFVGFRLGETMPRRELCDELERLGAEVVECRAVYHVHRFVVTSFLKLCRLLHLPAVDRPFLSILGRLEKRQGKPGEVRSGWYTAVRARKRAASSPGKES